MLIETPLLCQIDWFRPTSGEPSVYSCSLADPTATSQTKFMKYFEQNTDNHAMLIKKMSENSPVSPFAPSNANHKIFQNLDPLSTILNMLSGSGKNDIDDSSDFKLLYKSPGGGVDEYVSPKEFLKKVSADTITEKNPDDIIEELISKLVDGESPTEEKSRKKKSKNS